MKNNQTDRNKQLNRKLEQLSPYSSRVRALWLMIIIATLISVIFSASGLSMLLTLILGIWLVFSLKHIEDLKREYEKKEKRGK
jgi:uncharacterized membrane protein